MADGAVPPARTPPRHGFGRIVQLFFSPSFPLVLVSLCGVSYLLAAALAAPEFGLWALLAMRVLRYARFETWAALGLGLLVVATLPLAWLAFHQRRRSGRSRLLGEWTFVAAVVAFTVGLRTLWAYDASDRQIYVYSFLLFIGWNGAVEAALGTLAILTRGAEPAQARPQEPV